MVGEWIEFDDHLDVGMRDKKESLRKTACFLDSTCPSTLLRQPLSRPTQVPREAWRRMAFCQLSSKTEKEVYHLYSPTCQHTSSFK